MPMRDTIKTIMSIKSTLAAAAAAPFLLSSAAFAGPYVNVEANASYPDGDYTGATTDLSLIHISEPTRPY